MWTYGGDQKADENALLERLKMYANIALTQEAPFAVRYDTPYKKRARSAIMLAGLAGTRLLFEVPELVPFVMFFVGFGLLGLGVLALLFFAFRQRPPAKPTAPTGPDGGTPVPTDVVQPPAPENPGTV